MLNAPHSTLRTIMSEYTNTGESPVGSVKLVRETATAILEQTDLDVPNLFFSKDRESDVSNGLDEFIAQVAESNQPPNGEIRAQALILNKRVYEAHHATAADERAAIERNRESYHPPQSSTTDSI